MTTSDTTPKRHGDDWAGSNHDHSMSELLQLDARLLASYLDELLDWIAGHIAQPPQRILDLGSGPGTGTFALAHRFSRAHLTAVDLSAQMVHQLRHQAEVHDIADRIDVVEADLDERWPGAVNAGRFDLIWTASFLHHLDSPGRALAQAHSSLRPGGVLAVTEMDSFPRFLPEDTGIARPGLEARLHAATNAEPHHDWTEALVEAGFVLDARRSFDVQVSGDQAGVDLRRYAQLFLAKLSPVAANSLSAEDAAALDALIDDAGADSVLRREDLSLHTPRTTWIARRP